MKHPSRSFPAFLGALFLALPLVITAQTRERFGISAKAGGVNTVVGRVLVTRKEQQPQLLTSTDDLAPEQTVVTGVGANAEVLLNPGSYFRLGENSEFQFEDISLDNLKLRLTKGSAIIEATGIADMDLGIKVATPHGEFTIWRTGVYRVDVQPNFAELAVRKGRASFGPNKTDVVKGGKVVTLTNGVAVVAKLQKDKDMLEDWSKQRAELLAKANARLSARTFNGYLASFNSWDAWSYNPRRFGLWAYSTRAGCYTFMPFYYGWSSPYGHFYDSFYWRGGCCRPRPDGYGNNPTVVNNYPGRSNTLVAECQRVERQPAVALRQVQF
jgi:FecR protein